MANTVQSEIELIEEVLVLLKIRKNEEAISIIENYNLFKSTDASKATLLHHTAASGNKKMTRYLLDKGCDVNAQDVDGTTPLMMALKGYHKVIIQSLIIAGADIMILDKKNESALHIFCRQHKFKIDTLQLILRELSKRILTNEAIAQELINHKCQLYKASYLRNAKVLEYMLERGYTTCVRHPITKQSVLHISVLLEDVDSVKLLIKYGADVNALDCNDMTPLFYIYYDNHEHKSAKIELIKILLDHKASLTSCSTLGYFQMGLTLCCGNYQAIRLLLQAHGDFKAQDSKGMNVLFYLAWNNNSGVIDELKPYIDKYDVNMADVEGTTPLHEAIAHKNVPMVKLLLEQGAEPNCALYQNSSTPLYEAFSEFEDESKDITDQCIELLLQHEADPQSVVIGRGGEKMTIIDAAIRTNSLDSLLPVLAHLAILEALRVPIQEIICTKINSNQPLKQFYKKCRKLLKRKISRSVTLFELLTANEKKMVHYSGKENLVLKLKRLSYKQNLISLYKYYYNTLNKRFRQGIRRRILLSKGATVICKISENRFDERGLIVDKILDYLNDESLQKLYNL